ncbi:hypothetical protein [Halothiobacillus sp.]|uniref:hypothetical protein n=1 Tax=Halothiobacillus sp. TaxID=1891311 RepID=UPI00261A62BA|nr:hypothetical protein [Halothiobacillus sp.]
MEPELMQMMARFKLKLLRVLSVKVDTYRFLAEREYALSILKTADQCEDEDLLVLSMQVSDYLGLLETPEVPSAANKPKTKPAPVTDEVKNKEKKDRYLFGARG